MTPAARATAKRDARRLGPPNAFGPWRSSASPGSSRSAVTATDRWDRPIRSPSTLRSRERRRAARRGWRWFERGARRSAGRAALPAVDGRVLRRGAAHRLPGQAAGARRQRRRQALPRRRRAEAAQPTAFIVGGAVGDKTGRGLALKGTFGGVNEHADVAWIALPAYPDQDRALPQTLAGLLGYEAAARVAAGAPSPPPRPLLEGYAGALEVIAREWRMGEGPRGRCRPTRAPAPSARCSRPCGRTATSSAPTGRRARRPSCWRIPGVAATVLYRLAQSKTVGRKIAPAEVYAPFVTDRVPAGVSPAAVLGPFRNFQAKLLVGLGARRARGATAARHRRSRRGLRPRAPGGARRRHPHLRHHHLRRDRQAGWGAPPTADPGPPCPS